MALKCNVTGNPKPNIQWYHNGKLIEYDWIVTYQEPKLLIQTYEEKDKGIYQCVATNVAGEAQATALLSLRAKQYNDAPKNVKCLPLNASTFKVIFDGPANYRVWQNQTNLLIDRNFYSKYNRYNVWCVFVFSHLYYSGQRLHILWRVSTSQNSHRKW